MAQLVKNLPAMRETWVRSLGWRRERLPGYSGLENSIGSPWGCKEPDTTEQISLALPM